jgi:hypothetical protein
MAQDEEPDTAKDDENDEDSNTSHVQDKKKKQTKRERPYAKFTLSELVNSECFSNDFEKIPPPKGMGGRNYNICEMVGLGTNDHEDIDWYNDILVSLINIAYLY